MFLNIHNEMFTFQQETVKKVIVIMSDVIKHFVQVQLQIYVWKMVFAIAARFLCAASSVVCVDW